MKFESRFGIGEVVCTAQNVSSDRAMMDIAVRVIGVAFYCGVTNKTGDSCNYICRLPNGTISSFLESELIGDPEFDQDIRGYPRTENGGQDDSSEAVD